MAFLLCGRGNAGPSLAKRWARSLALRPIRHALLDIDGNLQDQEGPTPGAAAALAKLRKGVAEIRFVTNQSQQNRAQLSASMLANGFSVDTTEIFTALRAARAIVDQEQLRPHCLLQKSAMEEFEGIPMGEPNAVVLGTAPESLNYEGLNVAMRILLSSPSARFIAVNKGRFFRSADGLVMMAGPFVAALEFATGKEALVVGKPNKSFFHSSLGSMVGACADEAVMIGDDVLDDVQGAMDCGLRAILVRTGKYCEGDESRCRTAPLAVVDNFAQAVEFLYDTGLVGNGRLETMH